MERSVEEPFFFFSERGENVRSRGANQKFSFGHVAPEMSSKHLRGDACQAVGRMCQDLGERLELEI